MSTTTETVWKGTLPDAKAYVESGSLPDGRYVLVFDFSFLPMYVSDAAEAIAEASVRMARAYDDGLVEHYEWDGQSLMVWPKVNPETTLGIAWTPVVIVIASILGLLGILYFAKDIMVSIVKIVEEVVKAFATPAGQVGGIALAIGGVALVGGVAYLAYRESSKRVPAKT